MFKCLKEALFTLATIVISLSFSNLSNAAGPFVDLSDAVVKDSVINPCILTDSCPPPQQTCSNIIVNKNTLGGGPCYKTTNASPNNTCGLDSAITLANGCSTSSVIKFDETKFPQAPANPDDNTIKLTAALPAIQPSNANNGIQIIGPKYRMTIDGNGSNNAFKITAGKDSKIDSLLFKNFAAGGSIVEVSGGTGFALGNNVSGPTGVLFYKNTIADATKNSNPTVPIFLSQFGTDLYVFALLTDDVGAGTYGNKLQFFNSTNPGTGEIPNTGVFLTGLTGVTDLPGGYGISTISTYKPVDPSGTVIPGKILVQAKFTASTFGSQTPVVFVNDTGKNVMQANLVPNPFPYSDTDGDSISNVTEGLNGTNPNLAEKNANGGFKDFCTATRNISTDANNPDYIPCFKSDGSALVSCASSPDCNLPLANQGGAPAAPGGDSVTGCSSAPLDSRSAPMSPFALLAGVVLCLGALGTRRLRLARSKR